MFGEDQVRTLLGPADPARGRQLPHIAASPAELIARAQTTSTIEYPEKRHPNRRLVLGAAAAAVTTGVAGAVIPALVKGGGTARTSQVPAPGSEGTVLVPMAFQVASNPPPAGPKLRALASGIGDAPYDKRTGQYEYHRIKSWGSARVTSPEGYTMSYVQDRRIWLAPDGSGRALTVQLDPEFPDEQSRDYWMRVRASESPEPGETHPPAGPQDFPARAREPLPTTHAGWVAKLTEGRSAVDTVKLVFDVYTVHVVSRATRTEILRVLAGVPGLAWRGTVTDRAGRRGVAISADDQGHGIQLVLVFDPATGAVQAYEYVFLRPQRELNAYSMFLAYDRTDQLGS